MLEHVQNLGSWIKTISSHSTGKSTTLSSPRTARALVGCLVRKLWPSLTSVTSVSNSTATENKDHTMENLIRMGMAVLVLIVLSILATEAWRSHRQTHHAAGNYSEERRMHLQCSTLWEIKMMTQSCQKKRKKEKNTVVVLRNCCDRMSGEQKFGIQREVEVS